jgi:hypothetical protein
MAQEGRRKALERGFRAGEGRESAFIETLLCRRGWHLAPAAYRAAAEKLRAGIRDVVFPQGSFPPPMPFVG